jgi:CYTH domain-containing protein
MTNKAPREIEKKFLVLNAPEVFNFSTRSDRETVDKLAGRLVTMLNPLRTNTTSDGRDAFFLIGGKSDFLRVRINETYGEVTLKHTDKKTTVDRVEYNLEMDPEKAETLVTMLSYAYSKPVCEIHKLSYTLWFSKTDNITVYCVDELPGKIFLEAEAKALLSVDMMVAFLGEIGLDLESQAKSLFQICRKEIKNVA